MEQYQHHAVARTPQQAKQLTGPSITEQQLMAIVQRLGSLVEQQAKQIRRLENDVQQLRESVVRTSR